MTGLTWIDLIIFGMNLFCLVTGFFRGFIGEIISLATTVSSLVLAILFSNTLAQWLMTSSYAQSLLMAATQVSGFNASQPAAYLAYAISFGVIFGVVSLLGLVINLIMTSFAAAGFFSLGNRLLGAVLGLAKSFLYALAIIFMVQLTPISSQSVWQGSKSVQLYSPYVQILANMISPIFGNLKQKMGQTVQNMGTTVQGLVH